MKDGDMEAKDLLARSAYQWAMKVAFKFGRGGGLDDSDIEEAALFGLAQTLNRWDVSRGRLTSAVYWSVRSAIGSTRRRLHPVACLPSTAQDVDKLDDERRAAVETLRKSVSLDYESADGFSIGETIADQPDDEIQRKEDLALMRFQYRWAIERVEPPRLRRVLQMRWDHH